MILPLDPGWTEPNGSQRDKTPVRVPKYPTLVPLLLGKILTPGYGRFVYCRPRPRNIILMPSRSSLQ